VSVTPGESRSGATAEWTFRLACGHEIVIPPGIASAAIVLHHRDECEGRAPPPPPRLAWWAPPLDAPSMVDVAPF